jgi:Domain of unknown function (DUF1772)
MSAERILLWLYVFVFGVQLGAGLYETLVVVPVWSAAPPETVWGWNAQRETNPQLAIDSGRRFWIYVTPAVGLLSVAALLAGWQTRPEHRAWLLAATLTSFVMTVITFAYFVPTLIGLMKSRSGEADASRVAASARLWAALNWVRVAVLIAAWLCALRALQIPSV